MKIKTGPYESDWKWYDLFPAIGVYTHVKRFSENYKNAVDFGPQAIGFGIDAVILGIEHSVLYNILTRL